MHVSRGKLEQGEETFGESNCHGRVFQKELLYSRPPRISVVGVSLVCKRESKNASDRYVVATKKEGTIMGHSPRKVSRVCSQFLRWRGTVTGRRKYPADLAQRGLEVPGSLLFKATLMEPVGSGSLFLGLK